MYGIIHKAIRGMTISKAGTAAWDNIVRSAGISASDMLTMKPYSDDVTLRLLAIVSAKLEIKPEQCLEMLGHFWITDFTPKDYTAVLPSMGSNPLDFIAGLNTLHEKLASVFVNYTPPKFDVRERRESFMLLAYNSSRTGLTPFVLGILHGLSDRTGYAMDIKLVSTQALKDGESSLIEVNLKGSLT